MEKIPKKKKHLFCFLKKDSTYLLNNRHIKVLFVGKNQPFQPLTFRYSELEIQKSKAKI